jgi:hypothetical protein
MLPPQTREQTGKGADVSLKAIAVCTLILFASSVPAQARGSAPRITSGPTATRDGDAVKITFAVSAPTDVEVAILDGKGRIVRHLAAGRLSENAPEPFKRDSLAQEIIWDGKGDYGEAAEGAAVRVRLGMRIGTVKPTDTGFKLPVKIKATNKPAPQVDPGRMYDVVSEAYSGNLSIRPAGDPDTGAVYYRRNHWDTWYRGQPPDGVPVKVEGLRYVTGDIAFGSDGLIYPIHWGWVTRRLDRSWKPVPFPATGTHGIKTPPRNSRQLDAEGYGDSLGPDTPCLGLDGKLYRLACHPRTGYARLSVWGRDGRLERSGVFPFSRIRHGSVLRVDREGCLYVALNGLPEGTAVPAALEHGYNRHFSGTLVKLRVEGRWQTQGAPPDPEAGKVPRDAAGRAAGVVLDTWTTTWSGNPRWGYVYSGQRGRATMKPTKAFVSNVEWAVPGISWISPPGNCTCNGPWFDLDRFARLFVPDPARSRVHILDSGGNPIAELAGKAGDLRIAWPIRVAAAGDVFVLWDAINHRALAATLEYAATATCPLPPGRREQ